MTSAATTPTPTPAPICPSCGATLHLEPDGDLHSWVCPSGHGLGFTITEAYERIDEDEIRAIWQQARGASPGSRACPMCGRVMASVEVAPAPGSSGALALKRCQAAAGR